MRPLGTIFLAAAFVCGCEPSSHQERPIAQVDSGVPVLQVGLVLDSPSADSTQMAFSQKRRGGRNTNEVLNVRKIPGLDDAALESEWQVWQRGDSVCAEVHFKGKARDQLADLTRTNIGKDLALIVDGRVSWTMVIGGEVSDGRMLVPGDWTLKDAQAFCKRTTQRAGR